ncbi:hypothetical protein HF888_04550 [Bermanella marisrubri]|uniref:Uracil-DNA glycosylase n=1 Tax=Bermanella marisrubri TaxID=207949 RepID=Q1N1I4_9GAMM|nr:hypothetical protein [Bermanella marisrubri]EAT12066.1 uracil-DNA glycosylase [Oceanobacter sp. RED65] [Bermanella marisrubri]QIZ83534.1 hypothetical protein HF888_04550 [Bermanella marisrubri]
MTAFDVAAQSFRFYGRVFNKVFWISLGSNLAPLLLGGSIAGAGMMTQQMDVSVAGLLIAMLVGFFFYTLQLVFIHQFSEEQDDSLTAALPKALKKMGPMILVSFAIGVFCFLVAIPIAIVAGLIFPNEMGSGEAHGAALLLMLFIAVPILFIIYRLVFAAYHVVLKDAGPIEGMKLSSEQVKSSSIVLRGLLLMMAMLVAWAIFSGIISSMIALPQAATQFVLFVANVLITPYFGIFIYRLFCVTLLDNSKPAIPDQNSGDDNGE